MRRSDSQRQGRGNRIWYRWTAFAIGRKRLNPRGREGSRRGRSVSWRLFEGFSGQYTDGLHASNRLRPSMTGAAKERFDFLVRTREVKANEVEAYQVWRKKQGPKYLSPNHLAALAALRQLTGSN